MKRLLIIVWLLGVGFSVQPASAQVNVNVNIGTRPAWGPSGYDYAEYYYLPEIETYYNVPRGQFVYISNGNWVFSTTLPSRYRSYDLYHTRKVVLRGSKPYRHFNKHRVTYGKHGKGHDYRSGKHLIGRNQGGDYRKGRKHIIRHDNGHKKGHHKGHQGRGRH